MNSKRNALLASLAALGMILPGFAGVAVSGAGEGPSSTAALLATGVLVDASVKGQADAVGHDSQLSGVSSGPSLAVWVPREECDFEGSEYSHTQLVASIQPIALALGASRGSDESAEVLARATRAPRGPPSA